MDGTIAWVGDHGALLWALGLLGVVSLALTVAILPVLAVRLPADYFRYRQRRRERAAAPSLARRAVLVAKNGLGALLILAGIAMLVLPGQGLLTLLIGLTLTDFPGKYALEKRIVGQPGVLQAVNWLRRRAGRGPLLPPADED